jgi:hypothetical protein
MVQTKRPPVIKWNPYNLGETKQEIMKTVKEIVAKKDFRRKTGLELGALREYKGNPHWNLFVTIELVELMSKRLNNDLRTVFLQTTQGINNTSNYLANISQQLKKTEYDLNNVTTVANNNVMKVVKGEVAKLNKVINTMQTTQKEMKAYTTNIQEELTKVTENIQNAFNEQIHNIITELVDRNEEAQSVITEDIRNLKATTIKKFQEVNGNLNKVDEKTSETINEVFNKLSSIRADLNKTEEHVTVFQEATNNMIDDQQNAIITEFQGGIGGLMKQNLENFSKLGKDNTGLKKDINKKIDETTGTLTEIFDATNSHLDKVQEQIKEDMKLTENEYKKDMNKEITDLRAILSTIRSDIELMKSVLTKVDAKIH